MDRISYLEITASFLFIVYGAVGLYLLLPQRSRAANFRLGLFVALAIPVAFGVIFTLLYSTTDYIDLGNQALVFFLLRIFFALVGLSAAAFVSIASPKWSPWVGLSLSLVSLSSFLYFLKSGNTEFVSSGCFYLFAISTVISAALTITSRDPVHSALWFAAVILSTSGLFLLSGAQFLAAGTVIVYAGAIIVTFLFVIMLAQQEGRAVYDRVSRAPFLATMASFVLLAGILYPLMLVKPKIPQKGLFYPKGDFTTTRLASISDRLSSSDRPELLKETLPRHQLVLERSMNTRSMLPEMSKTADKPAHVASLGAALFTEHLLAIELAGTLLFAALIGALAIATPKPPIRPVTTASPSKTA